MAIERANVAQAMTALDGLNKDETRAVVEEIQRANPELFPSNDADKTRLWSTLLIGLFVIAIASMVLSGILILNDEDGTAPVAIVSAVVAGVIGLFSKSPTS